MNLMINTLSPFGTNAAKASGRNSIVHNGPALTSPVHISSVCMDVMSGSGIVESGVFSCNHADYLRKASQVM